MPRNGSGTYSLPASYLATDGQTATAAQHNDPLEDLRTDANAQRPVTAGGTGGANEDQARDNLGITDRLDGTVAITPDLEDGTMFKGVAIGGDLLSTEGGKTLTGGFDVTPHDATTITTGTFTPDPADGNSQYMVNGGAHTLAPPTASMVVKYTNNASAGIVTTSGFTLVSGDELTTTNGEVFLLYIAIVDGTSHLNVVAMQ